MSASCIDGEPAGNILSYNVWGVNGIYRLGFPNREVEEGFIRFLLPYYANVNKVESPFEILKFVREVRAGDYESFFRRLQSFFSDIPYELARELELHCQNGYKIFVSHILINMT